jgi:AraC family carnitine catabolism transcriptional activator
VVFLLLPSFSMIGLVCALDPLRVANRFGGPLFRWRFVSLDGGPVRASDGIPVSADGRLDEIERCDLVLVCASFGYEAHLRGEVYAPLRRLARLGVRLGAMDTGVFVLAEAGLLNGYRATLHWESLPGFQESYPEVETTLSLFEIDRRRLTCAGGAASLDMMLEFLRRDFGTELPSIVADQLLHRRQSAPEDSLRQPGATRAGIGHPKLQRIVDLMEANIEDPLSNAALARQGGLSERQLARLCRDLMGLPPRRLYQRIRLERARHLLTYGRLGIREVAVACGFPSTAFFSRAFKAYFGAPPTSARRAAAPMLFERS